MHINTLIHTLTYTHTHTYIHAYTHMIERYWRWVDNADDFIADDGRGGGGRCIRRAAAISRYVQTNVLLLFFSSFFVLFTCVFVHYNTVCNTIQNMFCWWFFFSVCVICRQRRAFDRNAKKNTHNRTHSHTQILAVCSFLHNFGDAGLFFLTSWVHCLRCMWHDSNTKTNTHTHAHIDDCTLTHKLFVFTDVFI
jgi:hypothetical protein